MAVLATPFSVFLIPIAAVVCFFLYWTIESVAKISSEASKHRSDNELKMMLAQRGMSAAEIERVVSAKEGTKLHGPEASTESARAGAALPPHKRQPQHS